MRGASVRLPHHTPSRDLPEFPRDLDRYLTSPEPRRVAGTGGVSWRTLGILAGIVGGLLGLFLLLLGPAIARAHQETSAFWMLRVIYIVASAYKADPLRTPAMYPASLDAVSTEGAEYLPKKWLKAITNPAGWRGYRFAYVRESPTQFTCVASPLNPHRGLRFFYIDERGQIFIKPEPPAREHPGVPVPFD